jgi:hypothetical protein
MTSCNARPPGRCIRHPNTDAPIPPPEQVSRTASDDRANGRTPPEICQALSEQMARLTPPYVAPSSATVTHRARPVGARGPVQRLLGDALAAKVPSAPVTHADRDVSGVHAEAFPDQPRELGRQDPATALDPTRSPLEAFAAAAATQSSTLKPYALTASEPGKRWSPEGHSSVQPRRLRRREVPSCNRPRDDPGAATDADRPYRSHPSPTCSLGPGDDRPTRDIRRVDGVTPSTTASAPDPGPRGVNQGRRAPLPPVR